MHNSLELYTEEVTEQVEGERSIITTTLRHFTGCYLPTGRLLSSNLQYVIKLYCMVQNFHVTKFLRKLQNRIFAFNF